MRLLVVKQPFANLITLKFKLKESRFWTQEQLTYRGELLICAAKKSMRPAEVRKIVSPEQWSEFEEIRRKLPHDIYEPRGVAQCVVTLIDYRAMSKEDEKETFVQYHPSLKILCLENIRPVVSFPVKGMLGLPSADQYKDLIRFD